MPAERAEIPNEMATMNPAAANGRASRAPARATGEDLRVDALTPRTLARPRPWSQSGCWEGAISAADGQVERLGQQLVGAPPGGVVVGDRHGDALLGAVVVGQLLDLRTDLVDRADDRPPGGWAGLRRDERILALGLQEAHRLLGRRHRDEPP